MTLISQNQSKITKFCYNGDFENSDSEYEYQGYRVLDYNEYVPRLKEIIEQLKTTILEHSSLQSVEDSLEIDLIINDFEILVFNQGYNTGNELNKEIGLLTDDEYNLQLQALSRVLKLYIFQSKRNFKAEDDLINTKINELKDLIFNHGYQTYSNVLATLTSNYRLKTTDNNNRNGNN
jgi:hypothetical protein